MVVVVALFKTPTATPAATPAARSEARPGGGATRPRVAGSVANATRARRRRPNMVSVEA